VTSGDPDEDTDEVLCSICLSPVEEGARIGALPCNHIFHIDCLKSWIKRRNVCPLCQEPNIAAIRTERRVLNREPVGTVIQVQRRSNGLMRRNRQPNQRTNTERLRRRRRNQESRWTQTQVGNESPETEGENIELQVRNSGSVAGNGNIESSGGRMTSPT